jgi:hypothetical protein
MASMIDLLLDSIISNATSIQFSSNLASGISHGPILVEARDYMKAFLAAIKAETCLEIKLNLGCCTSIYERSERQYLIIFDISSCARLPSQHPCTAIGGRLRVKPGLPWRLPASAFVSRLSATRRNVGCLSFSCIST